MLCRMMAGEVQLQMRNGPQAWPAGRGGRGDSRGGKGRTGRKCGMGLPGLTGLQRSPGCSRSPAGRMGGIASLPPQWGWGRGQCGWGGRSLHLKMRAVLKLFLVPHGALPESCGPSSVQGYGGTNPSATRREGRSSHTEPTTGR